MAADYLSMSLTELKEEAKKRGLKNISTLRKQGLIDLLTETEPKAEPVKSAEPAKKAEPAPKAEPVPERRPDPSMDRPVQAGEMRRPVPQGQGVPVRRPVQGEGMERRVMQPRPGYTAHPQQSRPMSQENRGYASQEQRSSYGQERSSYGQEPRTYEQKNYETRIPAESTAPGAVASPKDIEALDSGETKNGILEIMSDGFGFIRCDNYLPGENDVYVGPPLIRKYGLRTGDIICGNTKVKAPTEKFSALLYVKTINGTPVAEPFFRPKFENLTPIFPNERIHLETPGCSLAMRMVDLISPIGKGQRGMIVSQPKTGKTTLLKQVAKSITKNHKDMHLIILLIDERPEEVTDIKESIEGSQVEVIYSTFDELPENHKRVSEMVIERAKRLVEHGQDVVILLDSITRLARAYNLTVQASGRTLSGGLDPAALHMPKKFFGAARNMREGGSLTILATALVETGSRMDDVVFEEFKGTGNMELVLDRNLSERRVFPAIDLPRSSTRREDLLLNPAELEAANIMRRALNGLKAEESAERIISMFAQTKNNREFVEMVKKTKIIN